MRTMTSTLAVVLTLLVTGCRGSEAPAPVPEGFVDVRDTLARACADTTNTFECARAAEQYRLGKGVPGVTRVGRRLSIKTATGTVVDLTDERDPSAEDYAAYSYVETLACFDCHLVHRQLQDDERWLLLYVPTGGRIDMPGVPVLSPDCSRLAAVSGLPTGSVLRIWRRNEDGPASLEWDYQPDEPWTPADVVWDDATRLRVAFERESEPGTRATLRARRYTDGWRVER